MPTHDWHSPVLADKIRKTGPRRLRRGPPLTRAAGPDRRRRPPGSPPADAAWLSDSWGGPAGLAGSGCAWGAVRKGVVLAVACTYFRGGTYEDVACFTARQHRLRGLAAACVTALCQDIAARGRTPSWTCARDNKPSRLLAWTTGFRLQHEYDHYAVGRPRTPHAAVPEQRGAHPPRERV
ncbi:GNAT family N-acetyltransferase [Streptomyces boninensis]|uniref:GNAT family N-acetyltransferase n=1 Tax=Streptomyces boninensis TaxID=2039455 RepID=UPI003B2280C1